MQALLCQPIMQSKKSLTFLNSRKFILGTANLGQAYGISNSSNYNEEDSIKVIDEALRNNITNFDTAPDYGQAHALISRYSSEFNLKITTKVSSKVDFNEKSVISHIQDSLIKLNLKKFDTILFHNPNVIQEGNFNNVVKAILDSGMTSKVGVSVYNIGEILDAVENSPKVSTFQVPENILDRRLCNSTELANLYSNGINFTIRSIFLQGLILMNLDAIPIKFRKYEGIFKDMHRFALENEITLVDLCINYAISIPWMNNVIISAATPTQLKEIINFNYKKIDFSKIPVLPNEVLDPRVW